MKTLGRADRPGRPIRKSRSNVQTFPSGDGDHRPYRVDNFGPPAYNSVMALMLSNNRMVGGVCGGLAEWLGWDPTLVRILYTILTIFTAFSGVIVYLILWIIMPRKS